MKNTMILLALAALILGSINAKFTEEVEIGTCARFTSDRESCLQCIDHYHLFEGQCYRNIHGCNKYIFGSICQKCDVGFILVNNECCDKHCMAMIFKNYQDASLISTETEQEKLQRAIFEGYEKTVSTLVTTVITTSQYRFVSTSNQLLKDVIRYNIRVMINRSLYRVFADYHISSSEVTILEFRPESQMSKIVEVVLTDKQIVSNEQSKKAFQLANAQYGLRIYGFAIGEVSVTNYKYASQFRFIYLSKEKQLVYIFNIVVPSSRGNSYSPWFEERTDIQKVQEVIEKNAVIVKMEQNVEFQMVKTQVIKTNKVENTDIVIKAVTKVEANKFEYEYINKKTNQIFKEVAKVDPTSKKVEVISHKEVVSVDLKEMKLPESPVTKIITKDSIPTNTYIRETISYLEGVQPSLATKEIVSAEIQEIGEIKKITMMQKKDNQVTRVVVMKDERTDKMTLVDESVVNVEPPSKTVVQTTTEGTKKITTTNIQNLIKIDKNVDHVIKEVKKDLPEIDFEQITTADKVEGNMVDTYTFIVDDEKETIGGFKHQVVVVRNKKTDKVKIVDIEELESKPILEFIKRPVSILPVTEYETLEVKEIVKQIKESRPELKDQVLVVKKVEKEDKKFVSKFEVVVETQKGQEITVTANEKVGTHDIKITSVRETKPSLGLIFEQPSVSKVTVDKTTGVKTVVSTKKEQIKTSFVTSVVLQQVKNVVVKPTVEEIVSVKKQTFEKSEIQTVVIKTEKPQEYLQVICEKPIDSDEVTVIGEEIIFIEQGKPTLPVVNVQTIPAIQYKETVKKSTVLQTITQKIVKEQPVFENVVPVDTSIEEHEDYTLAVCVFESPQKPEEKQRVTTVYNKITKEVTIKEVTTMPENIPVVFVETDVTDDGHVTIVSNNVEEIKNEDTHIVEVIENISEQYPQISEEVVSISVTQTENSNNYVIVSKDQTTNEIVKIDINFNNEDNTIEWLDVQQIPEEEIIFTICPVKPEIVYTPEQIDESPVIQENIMPIIKEQITEPITKVTKVTEVKSSISTTYEVQVVTEDGDEETITVLTDNYKPEECTIIDIVTKPAKPSQQVIIRKEKTVKIVSTDSIQVVHTTVSDEKDYDDYLSIVRKAAEAKQPLLNKETLVCYYQNVYDSHVEVIYVAQTSWGYIEVVGWVNKADRSNVEIVSMPEQVEGNLETIEYSSCAARQIVTINHNSISLVSENNEAVSKAIDYVISTTKGNRVMQINYYTSYRTVIYVFMFELQSSTYRIVVRYNTVSQDFVVLEDSVLIKPGKPTTTQITTEEDGSTVIVSNSVTEITTVDNSYEQVIHDIQVQYPSITTSVVKEVQVTVQNDTNQYAITLVNPEGETTTVQSIYKKTENKVVVTKVQSKPKPLVQIQPRPKVVVEKKEYTSETMQTIVSQIQTVKTMPVKPFKPEDIQEVTKTETSFGQTFEITYGTPKGPETVVVCVRPNVQEIKVIDYKPIPVEIMPVKPVSIKTQFYVEEYSGVEVEQTNDITIIEKNPVIQNVKQVLVQQSTITENTQIIETLTKKSENKVQTTIVTKSPENPNVGYVIAAIYDSKTQTVEVLAEKKVELIGNKVPEIGQVFPSTKISTSVYKQVIKKDITLQNTISKVVENKPELEGIEPTTIIIDKVGHKIISTVTYSEQETVTVIETNMDTQEVFVVDTYVTPKDIKPIVFETQITDDGTSVIVSNSIEQISKKEENIHQILSDVKYIVPNMIIQEISGIKLEEHNGLQKVYIISKTEDRSNVQVVVAYDRTTKEVIVMDVQTISHEEIASQPEKIDTVVLSPTEIKEEKIEEIITNFQVSEIKDIKQIVEVKETVTGYAKIFDVVVENTQGQKFIVKTQKIEGDEPIIIDSIPQIQSPQPSVFSYDRIDSHTGILSTLTNNMTTIQSDRYYKSWSKQLEQEFKLVSTGYTIQSQSVSKLQRTNEYNVRYINSNHQAKDFRFTIDRTGRVVILEIKDINLKEATDEYLPQEKPALQIVKSQVVQSISKYPVIESSMRILESADYTFEGRKPEEVELRKYSKNTETVLFYHNQKDPSTYSRVVLMAETSEGAPITEKTKIPKILDISIIPKKIVAYYTKEQTDGFGRVQITTNDIKTLEVNTQFQEIVEFCRSHHQVLLDAHIDKVEINNYAYAVQYTITLTHGDHDCLIVVSVDKQGVKKIIDFHFKSPKSLAEAIPTREIQTVTTVVPVEQYTREDIVEVKVSLTSQLNIETIDFTNVRVEENPRVSLYYIEYTEPSSTEVHKINLIKAAGQTTYKVLSKATVVQVTKPRTPDSFTTSIVDTTTSFVVETTNDVVVIEKNPVIKQVMASLVANKVFTTSTEIIETITKTSTNKVETTMMVTYPSKPSVVEVIVTISDQETGEVQVIGQEEITIVEQVMPKLEEIVKPKVFTKEVIQKVVQKDVVIQSVTSSIMVKYPELTQEEPTSITQTTVGNTILSTVTYNKSKKVTQVVTDKKTHVSTVVVEEPMKELPKKPIITTTSVTKEGRVVIKTNNIVELETTQPVFQTVVQQLTQKYEINVETISQVTSTPTFNGDTYDIVIVEEDSPEVIQITVTTDNTSPEEPVIDVIDYIQVCEEIMPVEPEIYRPLPVEEQQTEEVQSVITWVQESTVIPEITQVTQVINISKQEGQLSTFYEMTVENTNHQTETVILSVDHATQETTLVEYKPAVIQSQVISQQESTTTIQVDTVTSVKTTTTTDVNVIKGDDIIQKVIKYIKKQRATYASWTVFSVVTQEMPSAIQVTVVFKSVSAPNTKPMERSIEFIALYDRKTTVIEIIGERVLQQVVTETGEITEQTTTTEESSIVVIYKETWSHAITDNIILSKVWNYVRQETGRFTSIIPRRTEILTLETVIRFVFTIEEGTSKYSIIALYNIQNTMIRIMGNVEPVKPVKPVYYETTVANNGRKTVVSTSVTEVTKAFSNIPDVIVKAQQQTVFQVDNVKKVTVKETFIGQTVTFVVDQPDSLEEIVIVCDKTKDTVKVIQVEDTPKTEIFKPQPRPKVVVEKKEFTSDTMQTIVSKVQTVKTTPIKPFKPEDIKEVIKSETSFGQTLEITYETPKGPETVVVCVKPNVQEIKVIDYKPLPVEKPVIPEPSVTQIYVEPITQTVCEQTTDIQQIVKNPVINTVKVELIKNNVIPKDSQIVKTHTSKTENKITTTVITKNPSKPEKVEAIVSIVDVSDNTVVIVGTKQITVSETKPMPEIKEIFPHSVITKIVYDQVIKKDPELVSVIKEVEIKHPELINVKPDTVTMDKIDNKILTTVTYEKEKIVSQVMTDLTTKNVTEVDSFVIKEENVEPLVLQTITKKSGEKIVTSNNFEQIVKVQPQVRPAIIKVNQIMPIKTEEIKTISVNDKEEYNIMIVKPDNHVTQLEFIHVPENIEEPILIIDTQEITGTTERCGVKQITYEEVPQDEPEVIDIIEEIKMLNSTNEILKNLVTEISKVQKSTSNFVTEYKTLVTTSEEKTACITVEIEEENPKPQIVDIVVYDPKEPIEEPAEIIETTNPRTDVVQTVYQSTMLFETDESSAQVQEFIKEITKTHKIESVVKEHYGSNNEYTVLLKNDEQAPTQIVLNINTFNGEITLMDNKTLVSNLEPEKSIFTKDLPKPQELTLTSVEEENVMIISKLSTVKDVVDFDEVKDIEVLEKDDLFVNGINEIKNMYSSILSESVVAKVYKKDNIDKEEFKAFFSGANSQLYEATLVLNRIIDQFVIESFSRIGGTEQETENSDLDIGADIAYGYAPLNDFSSDENIEFIMKYLKEHYETIQTALLQSVQILRLEGNKMNYKFFFKQNEESIKFIIFFEERFQRVLVIKSNVFQIADDYKLIVEKDLSVDPYFRIVDKYAKENHEEIAEGAQIMHAEMKILGKYYSYRTIYHANGKTYHFSMRLNKEDPDVLIEDYWNEIIEIPIQQSDHNLTPVQQVVKLSVSDLNSNKRFSEVNSKIKKQISELESAQTLGATSQSTLSKIVFKVYYSKDDQYYCVDVTYYVDNQKIMIDNFEKISLASGYTGVQTGHGSEEVLKWMQKFNPDLSAGVVSEVGMKSDLLGVMWRTVIKLPTKFVTMVILQEGNNYRTLSMSDQASTKPAELKSFPRPTPLISSLY